MPKSLYLFLILVGLTAFACTPAQSVSGSYNGTYSGSGLNVNSGNATVTVTGVGDNLVDINLSSVGNPGYSSDNVVVTKYTILGFTSYDLALNVYPWTLDGTMYELDNSLDYTLSNDTPFFYLSFDGSKQ